MWAGSQMSAAGLDAPAGTGEAWLVSDLPGASSVVRDGPEAGRTLADLVRERPRDLLGDASTGAGEGRFPLLVKLLDIGPPLSVQVHPNADVARALGDGDRGKCEAWLVLAVESGGAAYLGLGEGFGPDDVPRLSEAGTLLEHMPTFQPEVGEGIEILPGTLHAARGVLILEVQETCDITYRVYDYGRLRGPLHLEQARRCLLAGATRAPDRPAAPGWSPGRRGIAPRSPFRFEAIQLDEGAIVEIDSDRPGVLMVVEGRMAVGDLEVGPGEPVVLPVRRTQYQLCALSALRVGYAAPRR